LYHASKKLNAALVTLLLDRGARLDCIPSPEADMDEMSEMSHRHWPHPSGPLMAVLHNSRAAGAVMNRCIETLDRLITAGANIDAQDSEGATILAHAVMRAYPRMVQFLLLAGADPNVEDNKGRITLHLPVYYGGNSTTEIVQLLLPLTRNVNHRDHDGNTPLIELVRNDTNLAAVRSLLEAGAAAEINAFSLKGTALQNSTWWVTEEMMGVLLDAGADPNLVKGTNPSPLMGVASVNSGGPELIGLLLSRGANPNYATSDGKTALHVVLESPASSELASVRLLVEYGADVNAVWLNYEGIKLTPLALAWSSLLGSRDKDIGAFLLRQGADTTGISECDLAELRQALAR
jgi:ankyrin repeat protein